MKQLTFSSHQQVFSFSIDHHKILVFQSESKRFEFNKIINQLCHAMKNSEYADEKNTKPISLNVDEERISNKNVRINKIYLDDRFEESLKIKSDSVGMSILKNKFSVLENMEIVNQINSYFSILSLSLGSDDLPAYLSLGPMNLGIIGKVASFTTEKEGLEANYLDFNYVERLESVIRFYNESIDPLKLNLFLFECYDLDPLVFQVLERLKGLVLIECRKAHEIFNEEYFYFATADYCLDFANELLVRRDLMMKDRILNRTELLRYYLAI